MVTHSTPADGGLALRALTVLGGIELDYRYHLGDFDIGAAIGFRASTTSDEFKTGSGAALNNEYRYRRLQGSIEAGWRVLEEVRLFLGGSYTDYRADLDWNLFVENSGTVSFEVESDQPFDGFVGVEWNLDRFEGRLKLTGPENLGVELGFAIRF